MAIIETIPLSRSSELVKFDSGPDKHRCYSVSNPHYYKDSTGVLQTIQLEHHETVNLPTVGDAQISRRNITSVGIRKDGNNNKIIGLRPDKNQHLGNEQIEFTVQSVEFDSTSQNVVFTDCTSIDTITTDIGSLVVRSTRQGNRQLVKAQNVHSDFKITYKIDLTGLQIQNNIDTYTDTVVRESKSTSSNIEQASDSTALNNFLGITHISESIEGCFINGVDSIIATSADVDMQDIPSNWVQFPELPGDVNFCESVYMEDRLVVYIHNATVSESIIVDTVIDFLESITGGTVTSVAEGEKNRFSLDGVGFIGSWSFVGNIFKFSFATAAHPEADTVWTGGSQSVDAYYSCTYQDIVNEWDAFTSAYNTLMSIDEIKLSGSYYEPDENGKFIIDSTSSDTYFSLDKPKLVDDAYKVISDKTIHTLQLKEDGTIEYIKYADSGCKADGGLESCAYIDADIVYASNTDGGISGPYSSTWAQERNAASGGVVTTNQTSAASFVYCFEFKGFQIIRSFFMFDTSSISGTVTACDLNIYGFTRISGYSAGGVSCQQGTQGASLTLGDYDAFSGTYFDYIGAGSWNQSAYNTFTFNAAGIAAVDTEGLTQICCREYDHDYLNVAGYLEAEGCYYADTSGTTYDPYLEISTGGGPYMTASQRAVIFS